MLETITDSNAVIFDKLVQDYEEEFSPITKKQKDQQGKYALDSDWKAPNTGYYWVEDGKVAGFCIKGVQDVFSDILEFYVQPMYRRQGIGEKFASAVFNTEPGKWQVRQIEGADEAKKFWRKIIQRYTNGNYEELQMDDNYWGPVTCQRFVNEGKG